ncbi:MAG TPA: hypothetical protein VGO50_03070 [Pyrinomonadaceae bacterium]|nr:hypothetical protein [Pyrinomonadaceae bacterium]
MNPLHQTEREVNVGGLTRLISWLGILTIICAVVLSWLLLGPTVKPTRIDGLWIMVSWAVIVAIAVLAMILWGSAGRVNHLALRVFAILVIVLGTVTAFLSGDKFDALRAVTISLIMFIMSYRRREKAARVKEV